MASRSTGRTRIQLNNFLVLQKIEIRPCPAVVCGNFSNPTCDPIHVQSKYTLPDLYIAVYTENSICVSLQYRSYFVGIECKEKECNACGIDHLNDLTWYLRYKPMYKIRYHSET